MTIFTLNFETNISDVYGLEDTINSSNTLKSYSVLKKDKERKEFFAMLELSYPHFATQLDVAIQEGIVKNFTVVIKR